MSYLYLTVYAGLLTTLLRFLHLRWAVEMRHQKFHIWLAHILDQPIGDVSYLLSKQMAVEFLMSWSLFEARCFNGFMKIDGIEPYAKRVVEEEGYNCSELREVFNHFHHRYQDPEKQRNLFYINRLSKLKQIPSKFKEISTKDPSCVSPTDLVFFCTIVAYRFRNNIFHGNKGVGSWLKYQPQIEHCSTIVQHLVTHRESLSARLAMSKQ